MLYESKVLSLSPPPVPPLLGRVHRGNLGYTLTPGESTKLRMKLNFKVLCLLCTTLFATPMPPFSSSRPRSLSMSLQCLFVQATCVAVALPQSGYSEWYVVLVIDDKWLCQTASLIVT